MLFKNATGQRITNYDLGLDLAPGEFFEIPEGYARPTRMSNGSRGPSIIEKLCPQLTPADEDDKANWYAVPAHNHARPVAVEKKAELPEGLQNLKRKKNAAGAPRASEVGD